MGTLQLQPQNFTILFCTGQPYCLIILKYSAMLAISFMTGAGVAW